MGTRRRRFSDEFKQAVRDECLKDLASIPCLTDRDNCAHLLKCPTKALGCCVFHRECLLLARGLHEGQFYRDSSPRLTTQTQLNWSHSRESL